MFNGALDWVYNEELATRSSQPAYAWSPDGKCLIYLRLDEAEVQNHSVTDYRTVPPTLSYTRYPAAGSPNPKASLFVIDLESGRSSESRWRKMPNTSCRFSPGFRIPGSPLCDGQPRPYPARAEGLESR